jgi:hypothetical protein
MHRTAQVWTGTEFLPLGKILAFRNCSRCSAELARQRFKLNNRQQFAVLPPQDMRVGVGVIRNVPFVTPVRAAADVPDREEDGILATVLFQRVFISHADHYVIFDPR